MSVDVDKENHRSNKQFVFTHALGEAVGLFTEIDNQIEVANWISEFLNPLLVFFILNA